MTHTRLFERRAAVRQSWSLILMALVLAPMGCKQKKVRLGATDEETPKMQSVLNMGDPKVEPQLVTGFHGVEAAAWRWTEKQFTVALRPPFGASQKGAKLTVKLTVPPVTIEKLKSVSLSATAGGSALPPKPIPPPATIFTSATSRQARSRETRCAWISSWIRLCRLAAPTDANWESSC